MSHGFRFYHVYKGEYNFNKEIGISKENVEKLLGLMERVTGSTLDDAVLITDIESACEEILEELEDDE